MRVFTPTQAKTAQEERIGKEALRARTLAETTKELLETKNEVEQEFEQTMARHKAASEQFYAEELEKKKALKEEVLLLEQRRKDALSPLIQREKDIESREQQLCTDKELFESEKEEFEDKNRAFMKNLDILSTRQQELDEREDRVRRMEYGAQTQRDQIAHDAKNLALRLSAFLKDMQEKETAFAYRESELDAKVNLYNDKLKNIEEREEKITQSMRLLEDQRELLEKGFKELRGF